MSVAATLALLAAVSAAPATPPVSPDPAATRQRIDAALDRGYPELEALYRDIHAHPELAFQETRTAAVLAARMRALGFTVTEHVGKTGLVAIYRNGAGPTVMIRTELDALPLLEKTDLSYASHAEQPVEGKPTPVDHACGHDIHMAWWIGTADALLAIKDQWHGTLLFVAQPAEEIISGAKAMVADGLFTRFPRPDFSIAAHVGPDPTGTVTIKQGVMSSASDTVAITFHGVGAHGSMPDKAIDPIVEGAQFVTDVQTVISRRKDPKQFGVVTVGSFNGGTVANIIPDHADLQLTLRSFDPQVRALLNEGVATTAKAVAEMAHAPAPDVRHLFGAASVINDAALAAEYARLLVVALPSHRIDLVPESEPGGSASEDYSAFVEAGAGRSVYFGIGGYEPATIARYKAEGKPLPVNHSPYFAPAPEPSIKTGVEVLTIASLAAFNRSPASAR